MSVRPYTLRGCSDSNGRNWSGCLFAALQRSLAIIPLAIPARKQVFCDTEPWPAFHLTSAGPLLYSGPVTPVKWSVGRMKSSAVHWSLHTG